MQGNTSTWEEFTENFDRSDGGALYVRNNQDGTCSAVGVLWLDGGVDGNHYWAGACRYKSGEVSYSDVLVEDQYCAAEAFGGCVDGEVDHEIGVYETMGEAMRAVDRYVIG